MNKVAAMMAQKKQEPLRLNRHIEGLFQHLFDPLSGSLLPLIDGIYRHMLLRHNTIQQTYRVCDVNLNLYHHPGPTRPHQGPPMLLIHGMGDNALTWFWQMEPFSRVSPIYAVDLPGFGFSGCAPGKRHTSMREMHAILHSLITDVIGQPVVIVGNSLGGWLAVRLAWTTTEYIRGVVLLNPGGAPLGGYYSWKPFVDTVIKPDLPTVRQIFRQMFGGVILPLYLGQRSFQARFASDAVCQFIPTFQADDFLQPDELRRLPVPAGLVWGLADYFLPAGTMEFFRNHLQEARVLLISGCGHLPQRERPWSVTRFVRSFIHSRLNVSPPPVPAETAYYCLSPDR